jgi:hypothetical protein
MHRGGDTPFVHPQLNVTLQPLPFMEYLLEDLSQAVLISAEGAVLVNVPEPARFALHKLLIQGERKQAFRTKARKDLAQSAHLLSYLWTFREQQVRQALNDLRSRGRGWTSRLREGVRALNKAYPELAFWKSLLTGGKE